MKMQRTNSVGDQTSWHSGTQTHCRLVKRNFSFVCSVFCGGAAGWVFKYHCGLSMCEYFFVSVYSCSYSQCGLPWFQGMMSPIPPISGASLRDVLGSLVLSIVGGTKPLPASLTSTLLSPPFFLFRSSCHYWPFYSTHISSVGFGLLLVDGLFTCS